MTSILQKNRVLVVRGFIPDGLRSSPKTNHRECSELPRTQDLRLLRSRSGMNPLATMGQVSVRNLQIIQHPIHRQLPEHDQLRNPQQRPALRRWQEVGEVTGDGSC